MTMIRSCGPFLLLWLAVVVSAREEEEDGTLAFSGGNRIATDTIDAEEESWWSLQIDDESLVDDAFLRCTVPAENEDDDCPFVLLTNTRNDSVAEYIWHRRGFGCSRMTAQLPLEDEELFLRVRGATVDSTLACELVPGIQMYQSSAPFALTSTESISMYLNVYNDKDFAGSYRLGQEIECIAEDGVLEIAVREGRNATAPVFCAGPDRCSATITDATNPDLWVFATGIAANATISCRRVVEGYRVVAPGIPSEPFLLTGEEQPPFLLDSVNENMGIEGISACKVIPAHDEGVDPDYYNALTLTTEGHLYPFAEMDSNECVSDEFHPDHPDFCAVVFPGINATVSRAEGSQSEVPLRILCNDFDPFAIDGRYDDSPPVDLPKGHFFGFLIQPGLNGQSVCEATTSEGEVAVSTMKTGETGLGAPVECPQRACGMMGYVGLVVTAVTDATDVVVSCREATEEETQELVGAGEETVEGTTESAETSEEPEVEAESEAELSETDTSAPSGSDGVPSAAVSLRSMHAIVVAGGLIGRFMLN